LYLHHYSFELRISNRQQFAITPAFLFPYFLPYSDIILKSFSMNIYVSNLAFSIQDEELKNLFTPFGAVSSAKVINDRETGRSKGFGFVEMEDDNAAREAIQQLNQSQLDGRAMNVSEARPKPEKSYNKSPFKSDNGYNKRKW
jgi:RNA recognition motif-containing protein